MPNQRSLLGIIVPAYNEEERISPTLDRLNEYYSGQDYTWKVVVVDDGSTDRTVQIVSDFAKDHPNFEVLPYSPNRGKGYAVRKGMLEKDADILLFCDADLATPQEETTKLLESIRKGFDIAIGSRPLKESQLEIHQPLYREWLGRAFNRAVQALAVRGIDDTQCGFKMFTNSAAKEVFSRCQVDRFSFDIEALLVARDFGLKIDEVPIRWSHQAGSKVSVLKDGSRMMLDLMKLRMRGKKNRMTVKANLQLKP